jgi:CheY-like chemotaxis protein
MAQAIACDRPNGVARPKDREAAWAAGFDSHCAKPVRPAELIKAVLV